MAARRPVARSLKEYARGVAGGLFFSLPLLFTMEVWWTGHTAPPERLLVVVAGTFLLLLGFNVHAGLRDDSSFAESLLESVEELGLGLLVAAGVLALFGLLPPGASWGEVLGKVTLEGMIVAIGVSVGTEQLGGSAGGSDERNGDRERQRKGTGVGGELVIALCGAVLVAANVAPTEEVLVLSTTTSPPALLGVALLSLVLGGLLLYASDFRGAGRLADGRGPWGPLAGTVLTYAVALVASAAMLWAFGRFGDNGRAARLALVVVLGLPAMLGAAIGRLLLGETEDGNEENRSAMDT